MTADTPTIVLVHGAWADATGFGDVIRVLRDRGFAAIGVANPLRHLSGDAAYLADLLRSTSRGMLPAHLCHRDFGNCDPQFPTIPVAGTYILGARRRPLAKLRVP